MDFGVIGCDGMGFGLREARVRYLKYRAWGSLLRVG